MNDLVPRKREAVRSLVEDLDEVVGRADAALLGDIFDGAAPRGAASIRGVERLQPHLLELPPRLDRAERLRIHVREPRRHALVLVRPIAIVAHGRGQATAARRKRVLVQSLSDALRHVLLDLPVHTINSGIFGRTQPGFQPSNVRVAYAFFSGAQPLDTQTL